MLRLAIYGLTCVAIASAAWGAGSKYDGAYAGTETLLNGSAPPCAPTGIATVTINGNDMKFMDSQSHEFPLRFDPAPDGSFITAYQGRASMLVDVRGRVEGNVVDLDISDYGNGCSHHVHADNKHPSSLE